MKPVPGLDVHLVVNGQHLPELGDDTDEPQKPENPSSYVEATSGSTFCVDVLFGPEFPYANDDIRYAISLDSREVAAFLSHPPHTGSKTIKGVVTRNADLCTLERFVFADLRTSQ